uniref:Repulsive guidance molecule BMP co-receptor b n=3 Tax=Molossus molossus TaxID=27622 RepID=A0A7J8J1U2_MOLMO|nr:repulsive guidance molecule BMP co-receptor b [Molossus molossus]
MLFAPAASSSASRGGARRDRQGRCVRSGDEPHARPGPSSSGGAALTPGSGALLSHSGPACSRARRTLDPALPPPGAEGLRMMRKKKKRGASPGPCRSHGSGPATAPVPPPSPKPTRPAWTGMGLRAAPSCAAASAAVSGAEQRRRRPRLCPPPLALLLLLLLSLGLLHAGDCQQPAQCRIQKCTTDFVSLTSHLNSAIDGFDSEFCKALRAYAGCTQRTSKACRGNLVYHSAVLGISDLMSQRNCSKDGPTSSTNPEVTHDPCNYHSHAGAREHRGGDQNPPNYLFCGLFGDPHLRTFKDHFQTCKVEGAWPLIDNNYLSVQVTNVPVVPGSSATATNKITIIFKAHRECTDQKVYQAVTDDLPAAFVDGSTSGGDGDTKSLRIVERESGRYVEMHARYIGTTVFVRQLGRYLTLAIRMPEDLAMSYEESQDLQLCVNGCPLSERIDDGQGQVSAILGHTLPHSSLAQAWPGYTLETANAQCHEKMPVKDIYFQSCVFDLLTTGDANFTAAAHSALEDVGALHPRKERWHIFPSSGRGAPGGGGPSALSLGLTCLILIVFL